MDVRHLDDLDEVEYGEAVQALVATAGKLAGSCRMGWRLPWGVRVLVCEAMLAGEWSQGGRAGGGCREAGRKLPYGLAGEWKAEGTDARV